MKCKKSADDSLAACQTKRFGTCSVPDAVELLGVRSREGGVCPRYEGKPGRDELFGFDAGVFKTPALLGKEKNLPAFRLDPVQEFVPLHPSRKGAAILQCEGLFAGDSRCGPGQTGGCQ
jgi:hypothetical protein